MCHADDLLYLWEPVFDVDWVLLSGDDESVRNVMTSAWTNFAIYGDPTPPGSGLSWMPLVLDSVHQYWNISGTMAIHGNQPGDTGQDGALAPVVG